MFEWNDIIIYFERNTNFPREEEIWDEFRNHCKNILLLIPEIRNNKILKPFRPSINHIDFCLSNPRNQRVVEMYFESDDIVRITLYDEKESFDPNNLNIVRVKSDALITTLISYLVS